MRRKNKIKNYCAGKCSAGQHSSERQERITEPFLKKIPPEDLDTNISIYWLKRCNNCNCVFYDEDIGGQHTYTRLGGFKNDADGTWVKYSGPEY